MYFALGFLCEQEVFPGHYCFGNGCVHVLSIDFAYYYKLHLLTIQVSKQEYTIISVEFPPYCWDHERAVNCIVGLCGSDRILTSFVTPATVSSHTIYALQADWETRASYREWHTSEHVEFLWLMSWKWLYIVLMDDKTQGCPIKA